MKGSIIPIRHFESSCKRWLDEWINRSNTGNRSIPEPVDLSRRSIIIIQKGDNPVHATIQKPIEEIIDYIRPGEKVFIVGCNNCAWKCHSGGEDETATMAERLEKRGIEAAGYTVPGPQGMSLCKLDHTRKVLMEDYAEQVKQADSFLVLGCGQGVHTVIDAIEIEFSKAVGE